MGVTTEEAEVLDGTEDAEEGGDGDEQPVLIPFEGDGEDGPEDDGAGEAGGKHLPFAGRWWGGAGGGAWVGHEAAGGLRVN